MKRKLIIIPLLFVAIAAIAEMSLIIQPLSGEEQANAFAQIGYVKVTQDSLFVFSHSDSMLSKIAIKDVRHIRYGEPNDNSMSLDNTNVNTCRIYPNPAQDMLIINNANGETAYIFDLNGRLLQRVSIHNGNATLNVNTLPKGEYLLLINTQTYKFLKQ